MRVFSFQAAKLLERLATAGVRLKVHDGELFCKSSKNISPEVHGEIKRHKADLIELTEAGEANWNIQEEWDFERLVLPNGDTWMVGKRSDGKEIAWAVKREGPTSEGEKPLLDLREQNPTMKKVE